MLKVIFLLITVIAFSHGKKHSITCKDLENLRLVEIDEEQFMKQFKHGWFIPLKRKAVPQLENYDLEAIEYLPEWRNSFCFKQIHQKKSETLKIKAIGKYNNINHYYSIPNLKSHYKNYSKIFDLNMLGETRMVKMGHGMSYILQVTCTLNNFPTWNVISKYHRLSSHDRRRIFKQVKRIGFDPRQRKNVESPKTIKLKHHSCSHHHTKTHSSKKIETNLNREESSHETKSAENQKEDDNELYEKAKTNNDIVTNEIDIKLEASEATEEIIMRALRRFLREEESLIGGSVAHKNCLKAIGLEDLAMEGLHRIYSRDKNKLNDHITQTVENTETPGIASSSKKKANLKGKTKVIKKLIKVLRRFLNPSKTDANVAQAQQSGGYREKSDSSDDISSQGNDGTSQNLNNTPLNKTIEDKLIQEVAQNEQNESQPIPETKKDEPLVEISLINKLSSKSDEASESRDTVIAENLSKISILPGYNGSQNQTGNGSSNSSEAAKTEKSDKIVSSVVNKLLISDKTNENGDVKKTPKRRLRKKSRKVVLSEDNKSDPS